MQQQLHTVLLLGCAASCLLYKCSKSPHMPTHAGHSQQLCKRFMPKLQRSNSKSSFVSHECTHASLTQKKALLRSKCKSVHIKVTKGAAVSESRLCSRTTATTQHTPKINHTNVHALLRCNHSTTEPPALFHHCFMRFVLTSMHCCFNILYHAHNSAAAKHAAE
jgi:hypothetical protein